MLVAVILLGASVAAIAGAALMGPYSISPVAQVGGTLGFALLWLIIANARGGDRVTARTLALGIGAFTAVSAVELAGWALQPSLVPDRTLGTALLITSVLLTALAVFAIGAPNARRRNTGLSFVFVLAAMSCGLWLLTTGLPGAALGAGILVLGAAYAWVHRARPTVRTTDVH